MMAKDSADGENRSEAIRAYFKEHPEATNKEVVAGLKEKGIEVKEGLVSNVKSTSKKKRRARRAARVAAAKGSGGQPVVGQRGALSRAIRDYLKTHRRAMPLEIVAGLKEQGIIVSPTLANQVKVKLKKRRRQRMREAGVAAAPRVRAARGSISGDDLLEMKKLADQLGGVANARKALDLLDRLR